DVAALLVGHVREACEEQLHGGEQQRIAMHAGGVVGAWLCVDGGGGGGGACYRDRAPDGCALLGRQALEEDPARVEGQLLELLGGGGIGVDVALAHAHHARLQRDVKAGRVIVAHDELRGASADVDDH